MSERCRRKPELPGQARSQAGARERGQRTGLMGRMRRTRANSIGLEFVCGCWILRRLRHWMLHSCFKFLENGIGSMRKYLRMLPIDRNFLKPVFCVFLVWRRRWKKCERYRRQHEFSCAGVYRVWKARDGVCINALEFTYFTL